MDEHTKRFVEKREEVLGRGRMTWGLLAKIREMIFEVVDAELEEVPDVRPHGRAPERRRFGP